MLKRIFLFVFITCLAAASSVEAKSRYSQDFIRHFSQCIPYKESSYNVSYNSHDTYEIKGYNPDGSGRCVYVETNVWDRGSFVTTCMFSPKQQEEYFRAMLNPDVKTSVSIKGMAFVNSNEKAVYLKYYNNPAVCQTQTPQK